MITRVTKPKDIATTDEMIVIATASCGARLLKDTGSNDDF
jgi:hypothetical protein